MLPATLYTRCREVLLRCNEFQSYQALRAVFITEELSPFRNGLSNANNRNELVNLCLEYLIEQRLTGGFPVLPFFLAQLRERYQPGDALRDDLADLCNTLAAWSAVARIESPQGTGIGTGVLIGKNLLLTCDHIFSKSQAKQAWVRFNYTSGSHALDSNLFELDLDTATRSNQLDYALVRVKGEPKQQTANLIDAILDSSQEIRLIHYPQGKYVVISGLGQIVQVGDNYIDHNITTDEGSSGAPIFNRDWQLVAIHRGNLGIGRAGRSVEPGTTSGVPLRAFWNKIPTQLS